MRPTYGDNLDVSTDLTLLPCTYYSIICSPIDGRGIFKIISTFIISKKNFSFEISYFLNFTFEF